MFFQVLSDLHCEWYPTTYAKLLKRLAIPSVDGVIIAGDLGSVKYLEPAIREACTLWKKVIFVSGNHEYYHIGKNIDTVLDKLDTELKNFHWLQNKVIKLGNTWIFGTTLWFKDDPLNPMYYNHMNDFRVIPNLEKWVYKENTLAQDALTLFLTRQKREKVDNVVVVTHHAPSTKSIGVYYENSTINRFFVCDMEQLIGDVQPDFWIHGHMHGAFNYMLGDTEVICNPRGYPEVQDDYEDNEWFENASGFKNSLIIEI